MFYIHFGVFSNQHLAYQSDYAPWEMGEWLNFAIYNLRKATRGSSTFYIIIGLN